ncbi:MAG: LUD domain-containing protein [Ignavibacteriae bacterium]|nr:LUD domain-containing protein [Ignavibacteriota bacterium]
MSSKDKILSRVKIALSNKLEKEEIIPNTDDLLFSKINEFTMVKKSELIKQFENELQKINGEFLLVENFEKAAESITKILNSESENFVVTTNQELCLKIKNQIEKQIPQINFIVANDFNNEERKQKISEIKTSIVQADYAVSDIAQLIFFYDNSKTSFPHFLCDYVIAILEVKYLIPNQFELFKIIDKEKAKNMVMVAGPSRTADIEKVLVLGAHGPRKLLVIFVDDPSLDKN